MEVRTPKDVGQLIRARRRSAGLGQAELAERVGVSRQWIIATERGKPGAELGLVLATLDALGVRLRVGGDESNANIVTTPDIDDIIRRARKK